MKLFMLSFAALMLVGIPAFAQAPGGVHVVVPNGVSYYQSSALAGSLTGSGGLNITWDVASTSATVTITGTFTTSWLNPKFNIYWFSSPDNLPFVCHVVSNSADAWNFSAPFMPSGGSWDHSLSQSGVTGNLDFGYHYPACARFDLEITPVDQGVPYDMTIYMEWGPGTDTVAASFGSVKTLYR